MSTFINVSSASWIDPSDAQLIKPLAYLLLGVALAILALQEGKAQESRLGTGPLYVFLSTLFFVFAVSEFLLGDVYILEWTRILAREFGVYRFHRLFQWAVITLCAGWGVMEYDRLHQLVARTAATPMLQVLMKLGIVSFLVLYLLKTISFHYTDLVLKMPWMGLTVSAYLDVLNFILLVFCVVFIQIQKD
jgi:hypothetical protein